MQGKTLKEAIANSLNKPNKPLDEPQEVKVNFSPELQQKLHNLFYYTYVEREQYVNNHAADWYDYVIDKIKKEVPEVAEMEYALSIEGVRVFVKNKVNDVDALSQKIEKKFWEAINELDSEAYFEWLKDHVKRKIISCVKKVANDGSGSLEEAFNDLEEALETFKWIVMYGQKLRNVERALEELKRKKSLNGLKQKM